MIHELKYGKTNKHPLAFITELPKDKILIAVSKESKINYIISQLEETALAEYKRNYVYITSITPFTFYCGYPTIRIKIETLFDNYNVYQLENIKDINNL